MNTVSLYMPGAVKDALRDEASSFGMPLSRYVGHCLPLCEGTDGKARIEPRKVAAEDVVVVGYRERKRVCIGSLASVLALAPDGRDFSGEAPIVISPAEAAAALLHRAMAGHLTLTPDHLALAQSLRDTFDS